ncbi:hypothetical protein ECG581_0515 [Escherichia coli G58-1]|nr:uncharacterized membrane yahN domain protein [Escherichia coli 1827-70]EGX13260.1 hypothetical protein ECG581_0515 [Escherichia coli G58-1]EHV66782.1 homoserine/Threonine efflux protein [Escherichia coli DEC6C]
MMQLVHLFMDEITMDPLHAVYLTVGLFVITFLIREPISLW